jgi:hypothetical protein
MRLFTSLAVSLAAMTVSGTAMAQKAPQQFDGNWSVQVLTQKGDCEKVYRYPIKVENGTISYGGQEGISASGGVGKSGALKGSISAGDRRADVVGRVSGTSGTGTWKTSTGCSGNWTAEKRG